MCRLNPQILMPYNFPIDGSLVIPSQPEPDSEKQTRCLLDQPFPSSRVMLPTKNIRKHLPLYPSSSSSFVLVSHHLYSHTRPCSPSPSSPIKELPSQTKHHPYTHPPLKMPIPIAPLQYLFNFSIHRTTTIHRSSNATKHKLQPTKHRSNKS